MYELNTRLSDVIEIVIVIQVTHINSIQVPHD